MKNILIILFVGFTLLLFTGCSETEAGLDSSNDVKTYSNSKPSTQSRGILRENMVMENKAYSAIRGR